MLEVCALASGVRRRAVSALCLARLRVRGLGSLHVRNSLPLRRPLSSPLASYRCRTDANGSVASKTVSNTSLGTLARANIFTAGPELRRIGAHHGNVQNSFRMRTYAKMGVGGTSASIAKTVRSAAEHRVVINTYANALANSRTISTSGIIELQRPLESTLAQKQGWGPPRPDGLLP